MGLKSSSLTRFLVGKEVARAHFSGVLTTFTVHPCRVVQLEIGGGSLRPMPTLIKIAQTGNHVALLKFVSMRNAFSVLPITGINTWIFNSTRSFHERLTSEREGLESSDEGFKAEYASVPEKRFGWKRTPIFGFAASPKWNERRSQGRQQRYRRESVGNGDGNSWEGGGGASTAFPSSTSRATADPQSVIDIQTVKEIKIRERENEGHGRPDSKHELKSSRGTSSNGSFGQREGDGGSSQVNGRPLFKPKENDHDKLAKSRGEGDGGNTQAKGRPPFKPKANYYDKLAQSRRDGDGGSSRSTVLAPFKPKSNYYDTLGKESIPKPPFRPKANYHDKLGQSQPDGHGGRSQATSTPPFKPKANYYDTVGQSEREGRQNRPAFSSRDQSGESSHSSNSRGKSFTVENGRADRVHRGRELVDDSTGEGPHYGYKFRATGTKLGQFRRIGPPGRNVATGDSQGMRSDVRESGAPRRQTAVDSEGTGSQAPKQDFPQEEVRKYPPRRLEGEKRWQYAVRKKQLGLAGHTRGSTRKIVQEFVDDEQLGDEPQGDDWRRRKVAWLCKEIPPLRPRPLVTILNEQRKWINAVDTKYIIQHLLQIDQTLRAHRVLKWEMQQPWHEFDFELSTKVAVQLGQNNKLSRTRDMYDLIIKNGKVPDLPTYVALINCYIVDGENAAITQAWSLYNQMTQLGSHEPPPTLSYNLFQGLVQKGLNYLDQADELFKNIKMAGLVCSTEMYSLLIHAHGTKGNKDRVDSLIEEMKETGLPVGQDVYAAILRACAKDGNVAVGEQAFVDLKMTGHKPIPSVYSSLIKMYSKAGLPEKAFQTFEEMRATGTNPNLTVYEPMIEVAAFSGNREHAEKLLKEAQERGTPSLHGCYNAVMELYSKNGLLDELQRLFHEMGTRGYPPNHASFNVLLEAYVKNGLVEKAEAVYEDMKQGGKIRPNQRTYELMIKLYGERKNSEKLKEVFKELADKNLEVSEGANKFLGAAISAKQLEAHRNSKLKLNREHREILAGVLLAGAGIESHDRNRTYEIHFGLDPDSEVGSPLLNHLFQQFSAWSTEAPQRQPLPNPKDPTKSKILLAFQTVSHGSFRFFAHQYRPNHSTAIPRLVHRWLTPRALAYWYMYGGTKCPNTGDILLNASAYSDKEIMLVVNALKSRTIDCEKKRANNELAICFSGRSAIWLWGLMEPYVLPELKGLLKPEGGGDDLNQQL